MCTIYLPTWTWCVRSPSLIMCTRLQPITPEGYPALRPQLLLPCPLPPRHFTPQWFHSSHSWLTCSLSSKNHIFPHIKPMRQNNPKEYKRFSSSFSNLSPLDKLLVWFNTTQMESVQNCFYSINVGRVLLKCFASTNFSSQEKHIFIVKEREKRKLAGRWGEWTIFFWRAIWQYVSKAFDLVIPPLGIYHKAIIRSRCKNSPKNVHCSIIYKCQKTGINLNVRQQWISRTMIYILLINLLNTYLLSSHGVPGTMLKTGGVGGWRQTVSGPGEQWAVRRSALRTLMT